MLITMAKTLSAATKLDWSFFLIINSCVQLCCPHTTAGTKAYSDQAFQYSQTLYFLTEKFNVLIATNMKNKYIRSHLDTLEYKKLRR